MFRNQPWRSGNVSSQGWWSRRFAASNAAGGVFNTPRPYIPSVVPRVAVRQFSAESRGMDTMQNLNGRLASYMDKVSELQASNQNLERQIHDYLNQKAPEERRDFDAKFQTIDELRQQVNDYFCTISKLNLEIDNAEFETEDYQIKIDQEANACLSSESEIRLLQGLQRNGEALNAELKFELSQKEEEMAYLGVEREEKLLELRSRTSSSVNVELATIESADLIQELHHVREECMAVVEKNQREMERWFEKKMSAFQAQEAQDSTETESHTTVLRDLKKTFQNLTCELQQLHMQMSVLDQNNMEMTTRYSQCLHQYQMRVNCLEDELRRLRSNIDQQGALYQQLLDIKTHLELEITQYKKALDGEGISESASTSNMAVTSNHASCIDTGFKTSITTHSALTNGTHDHKQTISSAVSSSVEEWTGKTRRDQSRFLGEGSTGTLVVQEQIIVSKQNRPVTSERQQLGRTESTSSVRGASSNAIKDSTAKTTSQTSHVHSTHTVSQPAPQKYLLNVVGETVNLRGESQASAELQVSTSLSDQIHGKEAKDAAQSTHTTKTVEIKRTADTAEASLQGRAVEVKATSEVLQTNMAATGTQVANTGINTAQRLVKTSIFEKVMAWNAPQDLVEMNTEESEVEISAPEGTIEVKTTRCVVGTSAMESLLNTGIATGAVEAQIAHGVVEISAPDSNVEVKTSRTVVGTSALESLLDSGTATGVIESNVGQGLVEVSAPEGTIEVKTTRSVVGTSAMESLLNTGIATGVIESNVGQGLVEVSAPEGTIEVKTTKTVVGTSAMESLLNSGIATGVIESNVGQGLVEVSAPEGTIEVKTTRSVVGTSAMESLLNTGIATGAVEAQIAHGVVEISAPDSNVEVKTTKTVVGTCAMESLLNTGIATGAVESDIDHGVVEISAPEDKTTRIVVGSSAIESLLNTSSTTCAVETEIVQCMAQTPAPQSIAETTSIESIETNESVPTGIKSAVETSTTSSLQTSPPLGAIETNIVQGVTETQAPQDVVEIKTRASATESTCPVENMVENNMVQNVVMTSVVSEGTVGIKTSISEGVVESAKAQSVAEMTAPGSTAEIKTSEKIVETTGAEYVATVQTVEKIVPESIAEIKTTGGVDESSTTDTLLDTSFGDVVVETRLLESIAEIIVPDSTIVELNTTQSASAIATANSAVDVRDISSRDILLSNGTQNKFELDTTQQDSQTTSILQTGTADLSQSALSGHVSLSTGNVGIEGLTLDDLARNAGRSNAVVIGSSPREARISQARKMTSPEGRVEILSTSPGSDQRRTRQRSISPKVGITGSPGSPQRMIHQRSISPKGGNTGTGSDQRMTRQRSISPKGGYTGTGSTMMASPSDPNSSPGRIVHNSMGSQRRRLSSTGSLGSDIGTGGTGMVNINSPTKPAVVNSAGSGVWITSSDNTENRYTISTRSRGSGDKISIYGSGMSTGRISTTGSGNRISSAGSGGRISSAGSGNRISSAGSGNRISSAGSGNRISSAGSGGRISSAGSGGRISSAGSGNRISSAGSGSRISSAGSGGRISSAGTGNTRISSAAPMGSSANRMVIRSTGSSGGGNNRERISVCKMAALSKAAAVKEKSQEIQGLQQMRSGTQGAVDPEEEFTN